ncbi:MAG TPA: tannase/feruloyl esterase family alpha/beta hydrolase, partial [Cyclobacteriaceae bacterium]|nr:tannase/feruloyl esterase family alpha/beta hydrolase [Cyclobacteriaceae bacterium]
MKNLIHSTIILTLIFFAGYINGMAQSSDTYHPPCMSCDSLKYLRLPDVKINEVINIPAGEKSAAHCRVLGTIGTEINFELLLPERWNRRYIMGGGGGFVGSVQNMASYTVHEGYATSGTDTGHKGNGIKADWALNNIERQVNFGFLAVHRTAEVSKVIALNYYGREALYSYFLGCSRGGGQALMEAQRFPDDFDGIVCGAPAFTWPAIGAEFIQNMQKIYPDPGNQTVPVITKNNLAMLENAILEKCDGIDGIKDGIMNDPRDCGFQLSSLPICKENKIRDDCFTPAQVDAIRTIYEGPSDGNRKIYPGFPFGGENDPIGWPAWIVGPNEGTMNLNFPSLQYGFGTEMFKYLVFNDPEWDFHSYDFSSFFEETKFTSSFLDADGADYSRFNANGNKLILYHGWS